MGCSGSFYVTPYHTTSIDQWGNVTSRISGASSEGSNPSLFVPIPPPAVQKIGSFQVINDHSVKLFFKPIRDGWEDNGMSPLRRWEVVNGFGGTVLATKIYGGQAVLDETIQVDNLENGVRYELYLRAVNDIGPGATSYSEKVVVFIDAKPLAPTDLKAVTGDGQVTLSFTPATRGSRADSYEVLEMDGTRIVKVAASSISSSPTIIKNLLSTRAYTYTVRGVNSKGQGELSAPVTFTPALQAPKLVAEKSYSLAAGVVVSIKPANVGGEIANCTATGLPATLSISNTTCEIYGTLKAGSNLSVVVSAKNRIATDTASFTVSIVSCSVTPTKSNISRGDMLTATVSSTPTVKEVWVNCTDPQNLTGIILKDATGAVVTNTSVPVSITRLGAGMYTCKSWGYLSAPDSAGNTKTTCEDFMVNVDEGVTCGAGSAHFPSEPNANGQKNLCAVTWEKSYPASISNTRVFAIIAPGTVANAKCNDDGTFSDIQASCPMLPVDYCPGGVVTITSGANAAGQSQECRGFYPALPRNRQTDAGGTTPEAQRIAMDKPGSGVSVKCDADGNISSFFKTCPVPTTAVQASPAPMPYPFGGTPPDSPIVPNPPTIGLAYAGDTVANVSFVGTSPRNYPVTSYEVYVNNESAPRVTGATSPISITGLTNGESYFFRVKARNSVGLSLPSAASNTVIPTAALKEPSAPIIGKVSPGDSQVTINFTPPASNGGSPITRYDVYANGEATAIASGVSSPILVTGLVNGVPYTFRVRARNAIGPSEPSLASSSVTPMTTPGRPNTVAATAGDAQASVSFTPPTSTGGGTITYYEVFANDEVTAIASGQNSPIAVSGLTNGVSYTFKVKARNAVGLSDPSGASNSVTPAASVTRPGPPIIGIAVAGDTTATVSFTAPTITGGSPITAYEIYASGESIVRASGSASPITVSGLTNGVSYTFRVKARNAVGLSDPSGASNSVTPTHAHTQPIFHCNVVSSTLTAFSVNGEIIADSDHFDRPGRYFVAGYDSAAGVWHSFDGATWYLGGPDPTNLKAIANFSTIDAIGIRGIILSNEDMTPYKGDTIYIGYGLGNTDELAADDMRQNNRFRTCTTVPTQ